jgi:hypothetical protein
MDASYYDQEDEELSQPTSKKVIAESGKVTRIVRDTPESDEELESVVDEDEDEDMEELSDDEDFDSDSVDDVPDISEAYLDPTFIAQCNYLLAAARQLHSGTELVVNQEAAESLAEWVYENAWLPRKGFSDEEDVNPANAAPDFK